MNCQKEAFSLDDSITYLNCAFMSPLMKRVEKAGMEGVLRKQNPHLLSGNDFFEESNVLRQQFAQLISTDENERCVIIPSVSYGMANVAKNLSVSKDENIIVVGEQFPSNVYPWHEVAENTGAEIITVQPPKSSANRGKQWNQNILNAINKNTKLVACSHIHWTDGTIFDLMAIRKKTIAVGALLVVDATQSLGAFPFDVSEIKPDALIAAGYKSLMGPYSIGMAYYGPAFDEGSPIEQNWINRYESENFANLINYSSSYQPKALRYEVGEHSNFILVPMMLEAIKALNEWQPKHIKTYLDKIVAEPIKKLQNAGYITEDSEYRASNLFGIRLGENHTMTEIKAKLEAQKIFVSYRGDAIRISPNIYNTAEELEKLVSVLTS